MSCTHMREKREKRGISQININHILSALRLQSFKVWIVLIWVKQLVLFVRNNTLSRVVTEEIVWINTGWIVLYLNPSKATSQLNIFTHRSSPWALQVSQSQRSEEVCCCSLQLHIDPSETSLVQLITLFLERDRETTSQRREKVLFLFEWFILIGGFQCLKMN